MSSSNNQILSYGLTNPSSFRQVYSFELREKEARRILDKYPDRIPIICESFGDVKLDKSKYLVPKDITVGQFIYVLRKRVALKSEQNIFVFVNNTIPSISSLISELYEQYKDPDNLLYLTVKTESVYG